MPLNYDICMLKSLKCTRWVSIRNWNKNQKTFNISSLLILNFFLFFFLIFLWRAKREKKKKEKGYKHFKTPQLLSWLLLICYCGNNDFFQKHKYCWATEGSNSWEILHKQNRTTALNCFLLFVNFSCFLKKKEAVVSRFTSALQKPLFVKLVIEIIYKNLYSFYEP